MCLAVRDAGVGIRAGIRALCPGLVPACLPSGALVVCALPSGHGSAEHVGNQPGIPQGVSSGQWARVCIFSPAKVAPFSSSRARVRG